MVETRGIEEEEQVSIEVDLEEGVFTDHSDQQLGTPLYQPVIIVIRGDT